MSGLDVKATNWNLRRIPTWLLHIRQKPILLTEAVKGDRIMCRQIPNILTTIRIVCILLLIYKPLSATFVWLYVAAGVSDMLDGLLQRQFDAVTVFGEKYDSLADIILLECVCEIAAGISLATMERCMDRIDCCYQDAHFTIFLCVS